MLCLRKRDAALPLILPTSVLIARLTNFIRLEEQHLRYALVSVYLGRQAGSVGELQGHMAFPLGL